MAYTLGNKCAKNLSKRTLLVQLIIRNVVTCFLEHSVEWHNRSTGQGHITISFGDKEVKGQGHTTPPEIRFGGLILAPFIPFSRVGFYRTMLCIAPTMPSQDVVRPSVCLSHACILSKPLYLSSNIFHCRVATPF